MSACTAGLLDLPMWNIEQVEAEIMLAFFVIYYFLLLSGRSKRGEVGGTGEDTHQTRIMGSIIFSIITG